MALFGADTAAAAAKTEIMQRYVTGRRQRGIAKRITARRNNTSAAERDMVTRLTAGRRCAKHRSG